MCPQNCGESMVVTRSADYTLAWVETRRLKILPRALGAGLGPFLLVFLHSSSLSPPVQLYKDLFVRQCWTLLKTKALSGKDLEFCLSFHTSLPSVLSCSLAGSSVQTPVPYSSLLAGLISNVSIFSLSLSTPRPLSPYVCLLVCLRSCFVKGEIFRSLFPHPNTPFPENPSFNLENAFFDSPGFWVE